MRLRLRICGKFNAKWCKGAGKGCGKGRGRTCGYAAAGAAFNGIKGVQVKLCRFADCAAPLITISCGALNCDTPDE